MKILAALICLIPSLSFAGDVSFHQVKYHDFVLESLIADSEGNLYRRDNSFKTEVSITAEEALKNYNEMINKTIKEGEDERHAARNDYRETMKLIADYEAKLGIHAPTEKTGIDVYHNDFDRHIRNEEWVTLGLQYGDRIHATVSQYNKTPGVSLVAICGRIHKYDGPRNPMNESIEYCSAGLGFYRKLSLFK